MSNLLRANIEQMVLLGLMRNAKAKVVVFCILRYAFGIQLKKRICQYQKFLNFSITDQIAISFIFPLPSLTLKPQPTLCSPI
jgi:hypothetical protein